MGDNRHDRALYNHPRWAQPISLEAGPQSIYASEVRKVQPSDYHRPKNNFGVAAWEKQAGTAPLPSDGKMSASARFLATSTHRADFAHPLSPSMSTPHLDGGGHQCCEGHGGHAHGHAHHAGHTSHASQPQELRGRSQSAAGGMYVSPDNLGFSTTYRSMTAGDRSVVAPRPAPGPAEEEARMRKLMFTSEGLPRAKVADHAGHPRLESMTAYRESTQGQLPPDYRDMNRLSTTSNLQKGTTKASLHVPGYGGFVPASESSVSSLNQSLRSMDGRTDLKKDALLSTLQQFPHGRLPNSGTFNPSALVNMRDPREPTTETTQGSVNAFILSKAATHAATMPRDFHVKSNKGCSIPQKRLRMDTSSLRNTCGCSWASIFLHVH
eukprot:jgi/Mesvir1/24351/Mv11027-RA.2